MIPDEIEAFIRSVKDGTAPGAPAAPVRAARRRRAPEEARDLGRTLFPALADPEAAARIAGLHQRLTAGRAAARRAAEAAAAADSTARRDEVLAEAARRVGRARLAAELTADAVPTWYLIPQPFLIWPTGLALDDSESVDLQSCVRFRVVLDPGTETRGYVRFYYSWTNPFDDPVFVDLGVIGSWNGYCDVYLNGGIFAEDTAGAEVDAKLEMLEVWAGNGTFATMDIHQVFTATLQDRGFYSGYDERNAATSDGWLLSTQGILVPPTRTLVFTMTASVYAYVYDDGGASFDYSTGGYLFGSPAAFVTVTGRVVSP